MCIINAEGKSLGKGKSMPSNNFLHNRKSFIVRFF